MSHTLKFISEELISRTKKFIEEMIRDLRPYVKKIRESTNAFKATFTDGSFVLSDRRGAGIALFSSVSIKTKIKDTIKILTKEMINPSETLFVILPKFALRTRASTIMRALEYITTIKLCDDVKYAFLDGSYLTTLLLPFSVISSTFYDTTSSIQTDEEFSSFINFLEELSAIVSSILRSIKISSLSFENLIEIYYNAAERFLDLSGKFRRDLMIPLQNYSFIFLEQNLTALLLAELINRGKKLGFSPIWISKDSESRILAKEKGITGFSNDLTIMDFVLKKGEYIVLSDVITLPPVSKEKVTVDDLRKISRRTVYILLPEIANRIYDKFSEYDIIYAKFGDYSLQITFPRNLADPFEIVSDISRISYQRGYPEPMILVHNMAVLREKTIEVLSDGLSKKCEENKILCQLLSDSGRKKIGI